MHKVKDSTQNCSAVLSGECVAKAQSGAGTAYGVAATKMCRPGSLCVYLKVPDVEAIMHVLLGEIEGAKDICGQEGDELVRLSGAKKTEKGKVDKEEREMRHSRFMVTGNSLALLCT